MSPRIRYLKPDFFKDEDLAELPFEARLFFAGLWNFADKAGRLEDRPQRLKVEIFPYDKVDIEKCLNLLSKPKNGSGKPFIQRYMAKEERYIQIVNWDKHQKPHNTEKDSEIPPAPPLLLLIMEKGMEKGTIKGMESVGQGLPQLSNAQVTVKYPLKEIIDDLNLILGTSYKPNSLKTQEIIQARIKEGFTLDDFKVVHRKMLRAWGADEKMAKYLRPITLYGAKFESYLNMREVTTKLTETGIKAFIVGQAWLKKQQEDKDA